FPGAAIRVVVDSDGYPWVLNAQNSIFHWNGAQFVQVPGAAIDIATGPPDNSGHAQVWVIGTAAVGPPGNFGIYKYNVSNGTFQPLNGAATRIAAGSSAFGDPWVINAQLSIFHLVNGVFNQVPGAALDIDGGELKYVWVIGVNGAGPPGNKGIY